MNRSKIAQHYRSALEGFGNFATKAAVGGMALLPAAAFAQAPDLSDIETEIGLYKVAVVGLVIAFAVVLWAIRAAGLAKPR